MKNRLVLVFVAISVALIALIWVDNFTGSSAQATPSYYRDTTFEMDPNVSLTVTAQAVEFQQQFSGTPAPAAGEEQHGSGSGQGRGSGQGQHEEATAVPTPTNEATRTP